VTALGVPLYGSDGARAGTILGLLDLTEPLIVDLVEASRRLGTSGHADLVDDRGLVLASTNPSHVVSEGDHPEFYARAIAARTPVVETVEHITHPNDSDQSSRHVMALRHCGGRPGA